MSTLIPCPTCFAWVQQKSLGRHNTQKHPTIRGHGHDSLQNSLPSSDNIDRPLYHSGLEGVTEAEFEEEVVRLEDDELERMEVDLEKPALVIEENLLRHETFINAGISPLTGS